MSDSQPKILVATDGSKAAFHAAERAVYLAGHMGAKPYVLYAIDKGKVFHAGIHYGEDLREPHKAGTPATAEDAGAGCDEATDSGKLQAAEGEATEKVGVLADKQGVECEVLVVEGGRAARTIVWAAQEIESNYIVMGTEGMSRLETIMIGNVAQEVLRNAECTVLLVGGKRSPDDPMLSEPVSSDRKAEGQSS